jgi:hypothetical protein
VFTLTGGVDKNVPLCVQCDETINERLSRRPVPEPEPEPEEEDDELVCCGCGCDMEGAEDFGNNADVADTCCEACWDAHDTYELIRENWDDGHEDDDEFITELFHPNPTRREWVAILENQLADPVSLLPDAVVRITHWLQADHVNRRRV